MPSRGLLLVGLSIIIFASQAIWITFSPVASLVAGELGVSKGLVGLLAITFPAFFLALTIPSGILLDRSFHRWLTTGVVLTALGGALRILAPHSYAWLMACQLLAAVGQPFLLNAFAPFASRVYPESRGRAVSILSLSMYLGIIYGLGTGYWLYTHHGLDALIIPIAIVSLAGLALYLAAGPQTLLASRGEAAGMLGVLESLREVARARDIWLLGVILGLGVALFDNMSIWLEAALSPAGLGDVAGLSVALALLLGLAGVAVIPPVTARRNVRSAYIRGVTVAGLLIYSSLAVHTGRIEVLTLIPLLGLVMLPAYPIIMEWISTFHPREVHGSASGLIGFVSRIFTVTLASAAVAFIEGPRSYFAFLAALTLVALAFTLLLPKGR